MKVEIVANIITENGTRVQKTFEFDVDAPPETQDSGSIAIEGTDGEYIAEFRDWNYWRKVGESEAA